MLRTQNKRHSEGRKVNDAYNLRKGIQALYSSETDKNLIRRLKLCWAQGAGKVLQMVIHGEIGSQFPFPEATPETHEKKLTIRTSLTKRGGFGRFALDEDTVDFVHWDLCLEALCRKISEPGQRRSGP